jgi:hypothetical protein
VTVVAHPVLNEAGAGVPLRPVACDRLIVSLDKQIELMTEIDQLGVRRLGCGRIRGLDFCHQRHYPQADRRDIYAAPGQSALRKHGS